jgi:hypothetical protein
LAKFLAKFGRTIKDALKSRSQNRKRNLPIKTGLADLFPNGAVALAPTILSGLFYNRNIIVKTVLHDLTQSFMRVGFVPGIVAGDFFCEKFSHNIDHTKQRRKNETSGCA